MSLSAEWCGVPAPPRASRSLASRGSNAATGASVAWRHPKAAAAASPRCRRSASEVVCARKPTRLSNNKKKAKREAAKRGKSKGGGVRAGDGSVSPQQRVDAANHEARRWLGQHFLIDQSVILDAVAAADVRAGDRILEIGPGTGNLTVELLKAGARVDAVEKDRSLADKLAEQFRDEAALTVHRADFLKWDVEGAFRDGGDFNARARDVADGAAEPFAADAAEAGAPDAPALDSRAKVVANIPYNITTDILKTLLPMGDAFGNMVFMFQEEVARRLIKDEPGNSDYRPMSVRVHYYSTPYYIRPVTAACFDPPPNVESCLVGFRPRRPAEYLPLNGTERQFFAFVQACFAQKRKMLKNNLKAVCDEETIAAAFEALGKPEKTRAQELTMPEYVRLFNFVRDRGQARAEALAAGQNVQRVAPPGDEEKENERKPTKKQRETSLKVQRATSRLLAQAVEAKGSAAAEEHERSTR